MIRMLSRKSASAGAIMSNMTTWICVGLLTCQATAQETTEPALTHDQILVTLPVFVTSIIATAIFTWTIAQYDRKRDKKLDRTTVMLERLEERLRNLEEPK